MIALAIIEDDEVYRLLLEELARRSGRYLITGSFESAEVALPALTRQPAEVAIVDLGLPGRSGTEAIAQLRECCPATRCVVVTGSEKTESLYAALAAGACGYLLKSDSPQQIRAALDELAVGGAPLSRGVAREVLASFSRTKEPDVGWEISGRERQIMDALARGGTYKEIGAQLGISAATVKNHLSRIYEKLQVRSGTEAAVKWLGRATKK